MIFLTPRTTSLEAAQADMDRFVQFTPRPERVQIDIVDGEFADELSIDPLQLAELDLHGCSYDLHLMTVEPGGWLQACSGDPRLKTVIAQVERMHSLSHYIADVREQGWQVGLSFNLHTPIIDTLEELGEEAPELLRQVSVVQVMGNFAGRQGQPLHSSIPTTVAQLKAWRQQQHLAFRIVVDIGVNDETRALLHAAGADDYAVGSFVAQTRPNDERTAQERWQSLVAQL